MLQVVELAAELILLVADERLILLEIETVSSQTFRSVVHFAAKRSCDIFCDTGELKTGYLRRLQQRVQLLRFDRVDVKAVEVVIIKLSLIRLIIRAALARALLTLDVDTDVAELFGLVG